MIRYNYLTTRPRLQRPPCDPPCDPPAQNMGVSTLSPQDLRPLDSNGKEAFSRRKELPSGGLRRMKMPQEKNGGNTDLKCDLVLCRNKDYEKRGHHKIGSL